MTDTKPASDRNDSGLTILGALSQLRDDIEALQNENKQKGREPLFMIEEGELELKLIAKKDIKAEGKAQAKFRLFVVDAEVGANGSGASSTEHLQTLKIKFKSLTSKAGGESKRISFGKDEGPANIPGPVFGVDPDKYKG
jgi:hypothetical protein